MQKERGMTLLEVVIAFSLIAIILSGMVMMSAHSVSTATSIEERDVADVYFFYEDLKRNFILAKLYSTTPTSISITRIDDCQIDYTYDSAGKKIEKTATCQEGKIIVRNVSNFTVSTGVKRICFVLNKDYEWEPHRLCVGGN